MLSSAGQSGQASQGEALGYISICRQIMSTRINPVPGSIRTVSTADTGDKNVMISRTSAVYAFYLYIGLGVRKSNMYSYQAPIQDLDPQTDENGRSTED